MDLVLRIAVVIIFLIGFFGLQRPAIFANEATPPVHHYYQRGGTAELMFDIVSQLPFNDQ